MSGFSLTKSMLGSVLLGSTAVLFHTGSVLAADRGDDAQTQARELLAGPADRSAVTATRVAVPSGISQPALDPQEQARRLVLGTPRAATGVKNSAARSAEGRGIRRTYPDGQALAARMITGKTG